MGTEGIRTHVKNGKANKLSVPPGFVSLTSFTLSRVENSEELCSSTALGTESEPEQVQVDISCGRTDSSMLGQALRGRPWILYDQPTHNPEEHESEQQQQLEVVIARWHPESARVTSLEEAPVFRPSEEEFKDLLKYVASIRPKAESYGICHIIPPPSWQPPCILKEKNIWESSKFKTFIQRINELERIYSESKLQGINEKVMVKKRKILSMSLECGSGEGCASDQYQAGHHGEPFGFETGPEFTLETFKKYADNFKWQYFGMKGKDTDVDDSSLDMVNNWKPSVEIIEGEYRRNIENPSEEIEVLYGAEVNSTAFGSGFPAVSHSAETSEYAEYGESDWNMNNIHKLPGSLLAFESNKSSGILLPQLFVGMCFSSLCWVRF